MENERLKSELESLSAENDHLYVSLREAREAVDHEAAARTRNEAELVWTKEELTVAEAELERRSADAAVLRGVISALEAWQLERANAIHVAKDQAAQASAALARELLAKQCRKQPNAAMPLPVVGQARLPPNRHRAANYEPRRAWHDLNLVAAYMANGASSPQLGPVWIVDGDGASGRVGRRSFYTGNAVSPTTLPA